MFNTNIMKCRFFSFIILLILFQACTQDVSKEEKAVVGVVDKFFVAFATKDTVTVWETLLREGSFRCIREDGSMTDQTHTGFFERFVSMEDELVEVIEKPKVLIHKRLAVAWAPYVLYRNGELDHCGVNIFNMVDTSDGWKIAEIVYSYETTGCKDIPPGPPK